MRAGGDLDVIREGLALVLQALIDAEATQHIGAQPYERSEQRTAHRNGSRSRLLSTKAGDVELRIPKLREGSFLPGAAGAPSAHRPGLVGGGHGGLCARHPPPRKVDDLVKALGVDSGISKSEVSRICAELDTEVAAFRSRTLARSETPRPPTGSSSGRLARLRSVRSRSQLIRRRCIRPCWRSGCQRRGTDRPQRQ
jgi:putative transposase